MIFWLINDFVRSGYVRIYTGKMWGGGSNGFYWYTVPDGEDNASDFFFSNDDVFPDDTYDRYFGFSLRCLSTVLDR